MEEQNFEFHCKKGFPHFKQIGHAIRWPLKDHDVLTNAYGDKGTYSELVAKAFDRSAKLMDTDKAKQTAIRHKVTIEKLQEEKYEGIDMLRLSAVVKGSPRLLFATNMNMATMNRLDQTAAYSRELYRYPDNQTYISITLTRLGPQPVIKMRDFVDLSSFRELEDGTIEMVSQSVPDALGPSAKGYIRAKSMIWALRLEPMNLNEQEGDHCRITMINQALVGGWIPKGPINALAGDTLAKYIYAMETLGQEWAAGGQAEREIVRHGKCFSQ